MPTLDAVFSRGSFRSHMPFFDGETLLFCRSDDAVQQEFRHGGSLWRRLPRDRRLREQFKNVPQTVSLTYRSWKLHYCSWKDRQPQRLETGLGPNAIECSPAFYRENDEVHVSFIGGLPTAKRFVYHLCTMSGPSLEELAPAQQVAPLETSIGFVSPLYVCFGGRTLLVQERDSGAQHRVSVPVDHLYRATFRADDPHSLIFTGLHKNGEPQTWLFDMKSKETSQVISDIPVYKSTLFKDQLITAVKEGDGIENRQLKSGSYTLEKLTGEAAVQCAEMKKTIELPELQLT